MRLLLTIFLAFSIPENDCSTFYLIRHAEKVRINKTDRDPALNEKGMIRALNWRDFFIDKDISKIYSTNYKRTLETVKPIEVAMGLTAILTDSQMSEMRANSTQILGVFRWILHGLTVVWLSMLIAFAVPFDSAPSWLNEMANVHLWLASLYGLIFFSEGWLRARKRYVEK